jgi:flagellar hook-length control protein FliK
LLAVAPITIAPAALPTVATNNALSSTRRGIDAASAAISHTGQTLPFPVDLVAARSRTRNADSDLPLAGRLPSAVDARASVTEIPPPDAGNQRIDPGNEAGSRRPAIAGEDIAGITNPGNGELPQPSSATERSPTIDESAHGLSSTAWQPGAAAVAAATQPAPAALTVSVDRPPARLPPAFPDAAGRRQIPFDDLGAQRSSRAGSGQEENAAPLSAPADGTKAALAAAGHSLPRHEAASDPISAAARPLPASFAEILPATATGEPPAPRPLEAIVADLPAQPTPVANPLAFSTPAAQNPLGHANPPVAPQTLQTPLHDPAWNVEFGQKVLWMAHHDQQQAHLTINPPHLGAIEISINLNADQSASAAFVAADVEVRHALESSLPRLREMFASAGIDLAQVSVGSESFRQASEGQQQAPRTPRGRADKAILGDDLTGVSSAAGLAGRLGDGRVDTFA